MTLTKFIRTGAAALGALAVATQVNAADIYTGGGGGLKDVPVAPPLWTGFYAGVHLGAAWTNFGNNHNNFYDNCSTGANCDPSNGYGGSYNYSSTGTAWGDNGANNSSAFGGGQFGFNWMPAGWTSVVLGFEVDIDGLGNNDERTFVANTYGTDTNNSSSTSTLTGINTVRIRTEGGFAGDVTGRLGYTWGPALLYAKGGFAWLESRLSVRATSYDTINGTYGTSTSGAGYNDWNNDATLTGWTVGGGIEWLLTPNWSVKLEYLHFDFSNNDRNWNPAFSYDGGSTYTYYNNWRFHEDVTADTVKLGVNYHLVSSYAPLK